MRNKILHSVTNRRGGFVTPSLLASTEFNPSPETSDSAELRRLLGLSYTGDDYHVLAVLAAVEAHPDVLRAFQDGLRSYRLQDFTPALPWVSGGVMVADVAGVPQLRPIATSAPIPAAIQLAYVSASAASLTYGARYELIPCRTSGANVFPSWPQDLGISGGVQTTWAPGAVVSVYARPAVFPYQMMADALQVAGCKNGFLQQQGLLNNFHQAEDAQKKLAVVALALGLSNPAVYG